MTLSNIIDFVKRKPGEFRSIADIRRECFTESMRLDFLEADKKARAAEEARENFTRPSLRLIIGLACFGAKSLADVPAHERQRLELACIAHEKSAVIEFDAQVVTAPLLALLPVRQRLLQEFNEHVAIEFDREADHLTAYLREIFGIWGFADSVEAGSISELDYRTREPIAPVRELRRIAQQAREFVAKGCPFYLANPADAWSQLRKELGDVL